MSENNANQRIKFTPNESIRFGRTRTSTNIQIHGGNTIVDTKGCILVGDEISLDGNTIHNSKIAYERLRRKLVGCFACSKEGIKIEIITGLPSVKASTDKADEFLRMALQEKSSRMPVASVTRSVAKPKNLM